VLERPALLSAFELAIDRWKAAQPSAPTRPSNGGTPLRAVGPLSSVNPLRSVSTPNGGPSPASIIQLAPRDCDSGPPAAGHHGAPIVSLKRLRLQAVAESPVSSTDAVRLQPSGFQALSVVAGATREPSDFAYSSASGARQQAATRGKPEPKRTWVARLWGVNTEEPAWRLGADGEMLLSSELSELGSGWHVLHSIPIAHRNTEIDHVVVGPAGVFTIDAKYHPNAKVWVAEDTVLVNGYRKFYVRNSRHEAGWASRLLSTACGFPVSATGVVVLDSGGFTVKEGPRDVQVIHRRSSVAWLRAQPQRLGAEEVAAIFDAARKPLTWKER
jgi:hypothetical protein